MGPHDAFSADSRERATLLTLHTRELVSRESMPLWFSAGFVGAGAVATVALVAFPEQRREFVPASFACGVTTVASAISLFGSEDSQRRTLASVGFLPGTGVALSLALSVPDYRLPQLSSSAYAAGAFGTAAMASISALLEDGVPIATLRANLIALEDPTRRARLTSRELSRYERDFLSREHPIPLAVIFAPMGIGGLVALYPALERDRTPSARALAVTLGAAGIFVELAGLLSEHPVSGYRSDLNKLRLAPVFTASGVGLSGSF